MTFREKLADWISGGALSRARKREYVAWEMISVTDAQAHEAGYKAYRLQERLNRIAAMETTGANATVRCMAKTAREALQ